MLLHHVAAADDAKLICAREREEDDEGLVIHFTTSSKFSGCIVCHKAEKTSRHALPLKDVA